jgi:hypothetical protein
MAARNLALIACLLPSLAIAVFIIAIVLNVQF